MKMIKRILLSSMFIATFYSTIAQPSIKGSVFDKLYRFLKTLPDSTTCDQEYYEDGGFGLMINRFVDSPSTVKNRREARSAITIIADYVVADSFKVYKSVLLKYTNGANEISYQLFLNRKVLKEVRGRKKVSVEMKLFNFLYCIGHNATPQYILSGVNIGFGITDPNWKTNLDGVKSHVQTYADFIYDYALRGKQRKYPNLIFNMSDKNGSMLFPLIFPIKKDRLGEMIVGEYAK